MRQLFGLLDRQGLGLVHLDDLLDLLRPTLSPQRAAAVAAAFGHLSGALAGGAPEVDAGALVGAFQASRHPDVVAGRRSADEVGAIERFLGVAQRGWCS